MINIMLIFFDYNTFVDYILLKYISYFQVPNFVIVWERKSLWILLIGGIYLENTTMSTFTFYAEEKKHGEMMWIGSFEFFYRIYLQRTSSTRIAIFTFLVCLVFQVNGKRNTHKATAKEKDEVSSLVPRSDFAEAVWSRLDVLLSLLLIFVLLVNEVLKGHEISAFRL